MRARWLTKFVYALPNMCYFIKMKEVNEVADRLLQPLPGEAIGGNSFIIESQWELYIKTRFEVDHTTNHTLAFAVPC